MFSLIISIIAIALVIVLAGASLYYGGDAFNKGTAKGEAARYINEAQQIQAAVTLYKVENGGAAPDLSTDLSVLDGTYLTGATQLSAKWTSDINADILTSAVAPTQEVCDEINAASDTVTCADNAGTLEVTYDM